MSQYNSLVFLSRTQPTEHAESVVDGDDDNVSVRRQHAAIVRVASSHLKVVAVHEHHDRK